jgi:hypothetical protein
VFDRRARRSSSAGEPRPDDSIGAPWRHYS